MSHLVEKVHTLTAKLEASQKELLQLRVELSKQRGRENKSGQLLKVSSNNIPCMESEKSDHISGILLAYT